MIGRGGNKKHVQKACVFTHLMENWGAPPGASGGLSFLKVFLGPAAGPLLLEIKKHVKTQLFSTQRPPGHVKTHGFSKPKSAQGHPGEPRRAQEGAPRRAERALSRARMGAKRAQESPGTQESSGRPRRTHESLGKPRRSLS